MNSPTWSVVKFPQENAVSAVPTSWIQNNQCYWPPYSDNVTRIAIEKNEMVDIDNWRLYPCIPFRNATYDTFQEANKKSLIATKTSDLDTCNEDEAGTTYTISSRKRKIFKKTISFSEEGEEEESILPEAPRLKKRGKITADSSTRNAYSSCMNTLTDCTNREMTVNNVVESENIQLTSLPQLHDKSSVRDPLHTPRRTLDIRSHQMTQEKKRDADAVDSELIIKYLQQIIKKQSILQSIVMDISNRITNLEANGNTNNTAENIPNEESLFVLLADYLPVNSASQLQQLENYLNIPHQMENTIKEVSLIGGKDIYQFIFRAAPKLITNEFAGNTFSFLGRRNKQAFAKIHLNQLLVDASMRLFTTATIKDCENGINKWLRRCLDRCKKNKEN